MRHLLVAPASASGPTSASRTASAVRASPAPAPWPTSSTDGSATWSPGPSALGRRGTSIQLELLLGRDLQYIRINGTVVGAGVGLALHAMVLALASTFGRSLPVGRSAAAMSMPPLSPLRRIFTCPGHPGR